MNIFIYGSKSFKKDIHNILDHANIKFKLDEDSVIKDIDSLNELKKTVENSPHDIYLIEEEKIIKKNSLNAKVKFLTPKDGIDEEFLLEHSIPDITLDSIEDLPKYIIKKHDEYLEEKETFEVQNEIIGIVDDAYSNENDDFIDEELSSLLAKDDNVTESENSNDEVIDDFSNDGFDEYKFEENIDDKPLDNEISNIDEDEVQIVDFEKELENIDDLMDDEQASLDLSKVEDNLELDDLDSLVEESNIEESSNIEEDELEELDNLIDEVENKSEDETSTINEQNDLPEIEDDALDNLLSQLDVDSQDIEDNNDLSDLGDLNLDTLDELISAHDLNDIEETINEELALPNFDDLESKLDEITSNETEVEENDDKINDIDSLDEINNISFQKNETKGDEMSDDFSQLDSISEAELLEALGDTSIPTPSKALDKTKKSSSTSLESSNNSVELSSNNIEDLTKLFTQLLNNKTLEITIKIKD